MKKGIFKTNHYVNPLSFNSQDMLIPSPFFYLPCWEVGKESTGSFKLLGIEKDDLLPLEFVFGFFASVLALHVSKSLKFDSPEQPKTK